MENEIKFLSPFYKTNYIYKTSNISNGVINPDKNWGKIEMEYLNSSNQIIVVEPYQVRAVTATINVELIKVGN